jgi:uncharacterized membrane protein YagU involved in acid resistance
MEDGMEISIGSKSTEEPNVWKGVVAGLVGGLVATAVMTKFQNTWKEVQKKTEESQKENSGDSNNAKNTKGSESEENGSQQNPTVTVASKISEGVFNHELTEQEKEMAGSAVHYGFGTVVGTLYGAAAELAPVVTSGAGSLYGTGIWLAADEATLPATGLSKGPAEYPVSTHVYGLAAHLVYGLTAELTRRIVRRIL